MRRTASALGVTLALLLALGCASVHRTAGLALRELGTQFIETAALYDRALTTGAITRAEYDRFVVFAREFQRGYESAYVAWIAGTDPTDSLLALKNELILWALRLR